MDTYKTDEVFGLSRDLPLNYVDRPAVDEFFVENLTRSKHIVIYGSSKQGKTSLRKHCLEPDDYIVVQCSSEWDLRNIHESILKQAGFRITISETKTTSGQAKILARFNVSHSKATTTSDLDLDPNDVNDIIRALDSIDFRKYIVLEDFHYLPTESQRRFAVVLKAFHESSNYCFIVVGVWLEENRLTLYNGDLIGRVVAIDADRWTNEQLSDVIDKGATLLNIGIPESTKARLIRSSYSSVYVVQEACLRLCRDEHVYETQNTFRVVGTEADTDAVVAKIVAEQGGRYSAFIREFSGGFQASELEMYKWLLLPVLTSPVKDLQRGLPQRDLREFLYTHHPVGDQLNSGNLTIALQSVANLQSRKNIKPIVLDYDETGRVLRVVDRSFFPWISLQDLSELLLSAGFEADFVTRFLANDKNRLTLA